MWSFFVISIFIIISCFPLTFKIHLVNMQTISYPESLEKIMQRMAWTLTVLEKKPIHFAFSQISVLMFPLLCSSDLFLNFASCSITSSFPYRILSLSSRKLFFWNYGAVKRSDLWSHFFDFFFFEMVTALIGKVSQIRRTLSQNHLWPPCSLIVHT